LSEALAGFSARRTLPKWRSDWFRDIGPDSEPVSIVTATLVDPPPAKLLQATISPPRKSSEVGEVALLIDTFNRYFEPENVRAAIEVLRAAKYRVHIPLPLGSRRPLCCGRTFLSVGKVDEARREAERAVATLKPYVDCGIPVIGFEPSCILSFRDEIPALLKSADARRLADRAVQFEEFLAGAAEAGSLNLPLAPIAQRALLHGHCHQKSFGAMGSVEKVLKLVPDLAVETIESSCCGMAGSFGFDAETIDVSFAMGELSLLPAVRATPADTLIVADGTSCRHQIKDGAGRAALHVARVLAMSAAAAREKAV
jgi:Fe-S oxidoreductase